MIVLDTSALAKLLVEEAESPSLRATLADADDMFAISTLAVTELRRLGIRAQIAPERVDAVLEPFAVLRLTEGILQLAGRLPYRVLRTLDAIHVATAVVAEAHTLITFDRRQADAAHAEGLRVFGGEETTS